MKIFVTGGNGFVGTNLTAALKTAGHDVVVFDSAAPKTPLPQGTRWIDGNLENLEELRAAYQSQLPEVVFHLGARTDLHGKTVEEYGANTTGTRNLIAVMKDAGNSPFTVYASSRLVFAIDYKPQHLFDYKPSTVYGESKVLMEQIVLADASEAGKWAMVRPTSLWGPWFGIPYRDFFDTVRAGRYFNVAGHTPHKSYSFVGNAVYELISIMEAPRDSVHEQVLWLSDYPALSLEEWAGLIAKRFGVRAPRTIPYWLLRSAAFAGDAAKIVGYKEPPITAFRLNNLLTDMVYDTSPTEALVGDLPYSLVEGVDLTADWILNGTAPVWDLPAPRDQGK